MLGLSDAFIKAASSASASPIFLVDLQITDTENHKIISAPASGLNYPISVAEVSQVAGSLDIVSRKVKISECSVVVFDDDLVRSIFEESSREPKGRFVNVLIGFDGLDESDFAPYFRGILDELTPRPGHIELVLKNHSAIALDSKASGIGWYNKHPLEAITDILDIAGVPADAISVSELHPDSTQNEKYKNLVSSPGIEFSTAASDDPAAGKIGYKSTGPINASYQSVIESLAGMMHGACFTDEYGVVRFMAYDHDKAPIKHLTANDYRNFQQTGTYGNLCNHLKFIQKEGDGLENFVEFECEESQNAFMSPSGEKLKRTLVQNFSYCGVTDYTTTALLEPGGVANLGSESYDFDSRRTLEGISGLRITGSYPVTHWNTGGVSPDHPIYLLIDGSIIAVKEMQGTGSTSLSTAPGPDKKLVRNYSLGGVPQGMVYLPTVIRVTDAESGVLGTPEIEASDYFTGGVGIAQLSFIDVTAAVLWAEGYFKRFGHGCPTINIETSLDHYDLQIGDFITLDEAGEFYFDHKSGLSDSTVLEIVGKETNMTPSGAYISFKLAFVRRDGLPTLTIAAGFGVGLEASSAEGQGIMAGQDIAMTAHVFDGLGVAASAGLSVEIEKGKALLGKFKGSNPDPVTYPLEANKDTYMYFDPASGGFMSHAVTIGDPTPTSLGVLLSKITTSGSGVDSVEDLREFASITGGKLLPGSGPLTNLDKSGGYTGQVDIAQVMNAPDFTGISSSVAGLDQRVGTIEGDYATSGDIPDVSNFITNADLPDHSQFATTTALAAVSTVADGAIQSGQEQVTVRDINEKTSGLDDGLILNPSFYQFDQNGYPTHWYTWNTDNASDPNDNSTINIVDGNSTRGRYSVHINGSRFPDGSNPHTPVLLTKGCNVGYSDHLRIEIHCGATVPDTMNASWGVTVYYYYCLPDGSIYYTGANTGMTYGSDQFISGAATLGGGFQPRLFSLKIKPNGDQWWIDKATAAAASSWPDAPNYIGYPIEARFSFRQTNIVNDKYGFKVCYFNAHRVGNNVKDWDDSTVQYVADINTTAVAAQTTADNAQTTADAAAASHYALAELELRPADVPSGGWNDEVIIVCPTMLAGGGGGLIV